MTISNLAAIRPPIPMTGGIMFIRREIERTIDSMLRQFKVVLVTGARQVGKTTVLEERLGGRFSYVTMEDPASYDLAISDAVLFFQSQDLPLIIDEVQRVPALFQTTKWVVDQSSEKGRIVLTGSQTYELMQGVSESLAGRIRIIEMPALSLRELASKGDKPRKYVPSMLKSRDIDAPKGFDLWRRIHRGSMPELQDPDVDWGLFYTDYERAYLERDVRDLVNVKDEGRILSDSRLAQAVSGHHREPSLTPTFATRPFSRGLAADAQAPRRRLVAGALLEEVGRPRPEGLVEYGQDSLPFLDHHFPAQEMGGGPFMRGAPSF